MLLRYIIWGGERQYFGVPAELAVGPPRLCTRSRGQAPPGAGSRAAPAPAPVTFVSVAGKAANYTILGACLTKQRQKLLGCHLYRTYPGQPVSVGAFGMD